MSTLADIRKVAESPVRTCVDDDTPAGHFLVTVRVLGITTTYLCAGAETNPGASIAGRIEWYDNATPRAYAGDGIKGGRLMSGWIDSTEAFAAMVTQ